MTLHLHRPRLTTTTTYMDISQIILKHRRRRVRGWVGVVRGRDMRDFNPVYCGGWLIEHRTKYVMRKRPCICWVRVRLHVPKTIASHTRVLGEETQSPGIRESPRGVLSLPSSLLNTPNPNNKHPSHFLRGCFPRASLSAFRPTPKTHPTSCSFSSLSRPILHLHLPALFHCFKQRKCHLGGVGGFAFSGLQA